MCERIAKLNKEALGKISNTSKNYWRGCPSLLKFGQQILKWRQTNLQQTEEKLNYEMLSLTFDMKFIEAESAVSKNLTKWRSVAEHILKNMVFLTRRVNHQEHVSTLFKLFLWLINLPSNIFWCNTCFHFYRI